MNTKESIILKHVDSFNAWIKDNFSAHQIKEGNIDEAGYPKWNEIEADLEKIFFTVDIALLSKNEIDGMVYLIARSWDLSIIICWLNKGNYRQISQVGLNEDHFIFLLPHVISSKEEAAKFQFANVICFLKQLPMKERWSHLLKLYKSGKEYTKRRCLYALFELKYPKIEDKVISSWEMEEEYHKIGCLDLLNKMNSEYLDEYLEKGKKYTKWYYLQSMINEIKKA